jgi:Predicted O-linked N-acetylglucosamine transferase, SPINDLY family
MTTAEDYFSDGESFFKIGQFDKAIECLNKAIEQGKDDVAVYVLRGTLRSILRLHEEAIEDYNKVISSNTCTYDDILLAYTNRGHAKHLLKQNKEAIADYDEAMRINPNYAMAYNGRGNVKLDLGQTQDAIKDFNEAIERSQKNEKTMMYRHLMYGCRGRVKSDLGQYEEALEDLDIAINLNPYFFGLYVNRGCVKIDFI